MTKREILLKQRNAENASLTRYISPDGYVWKMIENAMEEYHQAKLKLLGMTDVNYPFPHYFDPSEDNDRFCRCGKYLTDDCHKREL